MSAPGFLRSTAARGAEGSLVDDLIRFRLQPPASPRANCTCESLVLGCWMLKVRCQMDKRKIIEAAENARK